MTGLAFFFFFFLLGDSAIVGLQTVSSIDFLSDAMKPGVLPRWEGGRSHGTFCPALPERKVTQKDNSGLD